MQLPTPSRILDAKTTKELVRFYLDNRPLALCDFDLSEDWLDENLPDKAAKVIVEDVLNENDDCLVEFTGFNCWKFNKLTEDGAKIIAKSGMSVVNLDTVAKVPLESIRILIKSKHIEVLSLFSLHRITPETAEVLSTFKGQTLKLDGLWDPSGKVAESLAKFPNKLSLGGIGGMRPKVAKALAKHKGDLSLDGLMVLFEEEALVLSKHQGKSLSFNSCFHTPSTVKKALRQYQGKLRTPWAHKMKKETPQPKKEK